LANFDIAFFFFPPAVFRPLDMEVSVTLISFVPPFPYSCVDFAKTLLCVVGGSLLFPPWPLEGGLQLSLFSLHKVSLSLALGQAALLFSPVRSRPLSIYGKRTMLPFLLNARDFSSFFSFLPQETCPPSFIDKQAIRFYPRLFPKISLND